MEFNCAKGDSIILTDNCSQTFSGIVKSINLELGRVVLSNIYQLPENKPVAGYRNFDRNEIVVLKKTKTDAESFIHDSIHNDDAKILEKPPPELPKPESDLHQIQKKPQLEHTFIRNCGSEFHSALSLLKDCPIIGLYGKEVSKGRFERASILAISTPSNVFVFDVLALGDDALEKGLKEILESPVIIKVVHDCRLLSDCLKHKHLISLENVRDIEAEDIMVVFRDRNMIRKHSRSLEYLTNVYLGMEIEECNDTGEVWKERPLPENLLQGVVSHAAVLLPLQEAIERKYLQKLIDASNIYNTHVRSLDFFDVLHNDYKKTLRIQMKKLVVPKNQTRNQSRSKKVL